jgi:citrate synthase
MPKRLPAFLSELPAPPQYNPVREALNETSDPKASAALQLFASMPPSTGVLANPVRYHEAVRCAEESVELSIRSFAIRGCLFEEDIVSGAADACRTIFVGLFGRFPKSEELKIFSLWLSQALHEATDRVLPAVAKFMKAFPEASTHVAMQYMAAVRKAESGSAGVRSRPPADLLRDMVNRHLENAAAGACSSYIRELLARKPQSSAAILVRQTKSFLESSSNDDPFTLMFDLLLRRAVNSTETRILQTLGTIQVHHGSAGSNMVARYLASLHTKAVSDIFTAGQMTLDSARHFGAITDMTEFVVQLERKSPRVQDELIHQRALAGNLPTFGHPEISAAGRNNRIEFDPRPTIYLNPLFKAIDSGDLKVSRERLRRISIVQRMYQLAFVEGIEKPGRSGRLRIAPNTDFGAWIVQESLGIAPTDRTFLSYLFRGFGWMMDVREQLQQPIIRPVIPPDPGIVPPQASEGIIKDIVRSIHDRLSESDAFAGR